MTDKSHTQVSVRNQLWLMGLTAAGRDGGMPYETSELACSLAQRPIFQGRL